MQKGNRESLVNQPRNFTVHVTHPLQPHLEMLIYTVADNLNRPINTFADFHRVTSPFPSNLTPHDLRSGSIEFINRETQERISFLKTNPQEIDKTNFLTELGLSEIVRYQAGVRI